MEAVASLFRRCDTLRFSGDGIEREAALALLDEFKALAGLLDAAERDRSRFAHSAAGTPEKRAGGAGWA
jgi:hypothetical protein